jgi:hypothetical protein
MTDALTGTPWLAVLNRIKTTTSNETTRVLAQMLWDIFNETSDPKVGEIADAYAYQLLRGM